MIKEFAPKKKEFVFGCIFLVWVGIFKLLVTLAETNPWFYYSVQSILLNLFSNYSVMLVVIVLTWVYAKNNSSVLRWSSTLFIFTLVDLIIAELHSLGRYAYSVSPVGLVNRALTIPYDALTYAAIGGFALYLITHRKNSHEKKEH